MKKIYTSSLIILLALNSYGQSVQQICLAQLVANSAGNLCSGQCKGSINCYPTGTGPYTYLWSNSATTQNITGLCAGTYVLTLTDAGAGGATCTGTTTITEPPVLSIIVSSVGSTATATVTGGTPGYTYMWMPGMYGTPTVSSLAPGTYTVSVTDKNGCYNYTTVTITATGIYALTSNNGVKIYPNPASDLLTIEISPENAGKTKITILNILGEIVYEENVTADKLLKQSLDLSKLPQGVYFAVIHFAGRTITNKVVKE
ncbi:MAG: T9SS type A sorting domain-containing protein [Bacteroidia bacterium]|nr:T9SS type A sorting domain-containing protein [Bacteroidia bacterium]